MLSWIVSQEQSDGQETRSGADRPERLRPRSNLCEQAHAAAGVVPGAWTRFPHQPGAAYAANAGAILLPVGPKTACQDRRSGQDDEKRGRAMARLGPARLSRHSAQAELAHKSIAGKRMAPVGRGGGLLLLQERQDGPERLGPGLQEICGCRAIPWADCRPLFLNA